MKNYICGSDIGSVWSVLISPDASTLAGRGFTPASFRPGGDDTDSSSHDFASS